jgi:aspartyl-tRNA(Asn)/glutamyl-tRNA(Gln) amidotransferase subunit C
MAEGAPAKLSLAEVRHIAKLARLRLTEDQLDRYRDQLASVLGHISKLNELDASEIDSSPQPADITARLDDDEVMPAMPFEALQHNAPAIEDRFLAVPKVFGETESA